MDDAHHYWVELNWSYPSVKSEIGFWKWTPHTDPSLHYSQIMWTTYLQCSNILRSVQWCECIVMTFQKLVQSFKPIYCAYFFHICPLDSQCFDSFLNCSIDLKNIVNYLIPWDIDYTQASTTPITKIKTPRVNTHQIWIYRCNDHFKHRVE